MKKGRKPPFEAVMAFVLMLLTAILAIDGFIFQDIPPEAAKYPIFVFAVIMISGTAEIIRVCRAQNKKDGEEKTEKPVFQNRKNFLVICGLIVGYLLLVWLLGFIAATILFTVAFTWYSKLEHLVLFNLIMAMVTVGTFFLFERILHIYLPVGLLFENLL